MDYCVSCGKPIETVQRADGTYQNHKCPTGHVKARERIHRGSGDSNYSPSYYTRLVHGFKILNSDESQS